MSRIRLQRHIQAGLSADIVCKEHHLQYTCALHADLEYAHLLNAHVSLAKELNSLEQLGPTLEPSGPCLLCITSLERLGASYRMRAAEFSLLPSLDRPKSLVDEAGNDLPSTEQPKRQHGTASKPRSG